MPDVYETGVLGVCVSRVFKFFFALKLRLKITLFIRAVTDTYRALNVLNGQYIIKFFIKIVGIRIFTKYSYIISLLNKITTLNIMLKLNTSSKVTLMKQQWFLLF